MNRTSLLVGLVFLVAASRVAHAQEDFPHPELNWHTIETGHFFVHYHDGAERTARTIAKIAEEIYDPVTSLYDHQPTQKVSFVVNDHDDISNGAAYFFDNKVEIYAPSMDFDLRGTHNWLRNVITHEFTHIVQIQTSMKFGRRMPAVYLQWLGYEAERRPDVLYGYPNIIVSYPLSGFVVPAWFAEGVAQYNRNDLKYDFWDTHRDMILRCYALDGNMLTWEQMGVFGKTSLGNESSYNAGFAFVSYLARVYGEDKLKEVSRNLATLQEVTIDGAIKRAVGKSGKEVYDEWRAEIERDYNARVAPMKGSLKEGKPLLVESEDGVFDPGELQRQESMFSPLTRGITPLAGMEACCALNANTGFANLYPEFSPDGKKVAYVSAKGADYFSLSSLYVYDRETKKETLIQPGVRTAFSWSPDGNKLYYGRNTRDNAHWSLQFDIYCYDLTTKEETRITTGRRALSPSISPDGKRLAFAITADGTSNVAVCNIDGSGFSIITPYTSGEQAYNPKWSPKGDRIVFDYSLKDGRDIALIDPDGSHLSYVVTGSADDRSAVFTRDGSHLLFSSDRTGIFNLYSYDLATTATMQVTNVIGGAFYPTINADGEIVYAAYTSGGYKIYTMTSGADSSAPAYLPSTIVVDAARPKTTPQFDWQRLRSYDDTNIPAVDGRPYRSIFTSLTFVPFLRIDNYNSKNTALDAVKPGVYLFSNDLLDKTGFFAGAALNRKLERDLFLQFSYRGKLPLLYQLGLEPVASIEVYNVTRKTSNTITLPADTIGVDVGYDLLEFDFALNQQFLSQFSTVEFRYTHSRYTSIIDAFVIPSTSILVPGSTDLYLIANDLSLTFTLDAVVPSRTMEINPIGTRAKLRIDRELNKFNGDGEYEVTSSGIRPKYKTVNFTRADLTWRQFMPFFFKNHTLTASLRAATIFGPPVDEFFDNYGGGLIGMKGYPFYAIGGNRLGVLGLTYRFPLINTIDVRVLQIYFDKLYGAVYSDFGNAWTGSVPSLNQWKHDAGVELRLESFSFYSYPTRFFFNAAYGFDRFDKYISSRNEYVTYGKEWRFYFGVLFGFDFD